jgi:hypothetical protein
MLHCDKPRSARGIGPGEEQVEPPVVECAVGIGEVPVGLEQVVPVQLTEIF